ncbi:MAG: 2-C-methyl-D-erythritol 4-phosphate cytidylyltransferase [Planctomycetes bacterium]|nr:2-C-methyl-D-erythritol 4-phosphate cytidylyltransferase [Planctomycetota bacterium]
MNIAVIIPAAGRSTRFGEADKLIQDLGGRALLIRSVEPFTRHDLVRSIIVAGPPEPPTAFELFRDRFGPTLGFHGATVVAGGRLDRWETVRNALAAVGDDATHVAVHDAARPNVSAALLDRLFDAATRFDAVIPGVPVRSTVKRVSEDAADATAGEPDAIADSILGDAGKSTAIARQVVETVDRERLIEVQTPQVFTVDLIRRAYAQPDLDGVTDDAGAVERLGETVHVVDGELGNMKITTPEDLELVRAIMKARPPKSKATF